jgi:hypothetical protein
MLDDKRIEEILAKEVCDNCKKDTADWFTGSTALCDDCAEKAGWLTK